MTYWPGTEKSPRQLAEEANLVSDVEDLVDAVQDVIDDITDGDDIVTDGETSEEEVAPSDAE